jgi:hypothetical protein
MFSKSVSPPLGFYPGVTIRRALALDREMKARRRGQSAPSAPPRSSICTAVSTPTRLPVMRATISAIRRQCAGSCWRGLSRRAGSRHARAGEPPCRFRRHGADERLGVGLRQPAASGWRRSHCASIVSHRATRDHPLGHRNNHRSSWPRPSAALPPIVGFFTTTSPARSRCSTGRLARIADTSSSALCTRFRAIEPKRESESARQVVG